MKNKLQSLFQSRRFWVAASGLIAVVGQKVLGMELDTEQLVAVAGIVMTWILGDTIRKTE